MNRLPLTFACGRYDRTEALRTGEISPEGIALNYIGIEASREIFDRMVGNHEFDCAELSSSEFIRMVDGGKAPFVAIPVFPSRVFRHGYIFVSKSSGVKEPRDLCREHMICPV
jgi:4,5-dihydroxyphthalate decarboxylase